MLDSDRYVSLSNDSERLLFIELLLMADDFGLVPLNYAFLRRRASPCSGRTEKQVEAMLESLIECDLVRTYRSDTGSLFGYIPRFGNVPRSKKPKWPLPPDQPAFNEINNLARSCTASASGCVAHAVRVRTNAPETETETETVEIHTQPTAVVASPDVEATTVAAAAVRKASASSSGVAPGDAIPDCPHEAILAEFARVLPMARQPAEWTDARRAMLRTRWRESAKRQSVEWWSRFFSYIAKSDFLCGRTESSGRRPFELSLDWLLKSSNFLKVIEGAYHQ